MNTHVWTHGGDGGTGAVYYLEATGDQGQTSETQKHFTEQSDVT